VAVLEQGPHAIEVRWFNRTGGAQLVLSWKSASRAAEPIPDSAFSH
jgi:hypothetical protein